ncbi:MAG: AAA family ATPase [Actinomycetaceae bacterium]|nr:AAA family ATPase [Actinomycetaceae bacterium]
MALKTRRPTGRSPWPFLLIAGGEKCGKSYACAEFSASPLTGRTLWIEVGESSADQYGALPGADYEIVDHDGTFPSILQAAIDATSEPATGRPNAIIVDSATNLWDLLCDEQQAVAARRGKTSPTMDQWNTAKRQWRQFVDVLRRHAGPVIVTARFEQVTVVDGGRPTGEKQWKIRAEKNLPFDVDGIVEIPHPRQYYLSGMRSLHLQVPPGEHMLLDVNFTIDGLLRQLDVDGTDRAYTPAREDPDRFTTGDMGRLDALLRQEGDQ